MSLITAFTESAIVSSMLSVDITPFETSVCQPLPLLPTMTSTVGSSTYQNNGTTVEPLLLYTPEVAGILGFDSVRPPTEVIEATIYRVVIVVVCSFGLVCNIFNLVVLSRKSLSSTMERLEQSAHYGLVSLAVSDAMFCIVVLPHALIPSRAFGYRQYDLRILYIVYGAAVVNTFTLSSTWLTVAMAVSRYVAICYPLHARQLIGRSFAVTTIGGVFGASFLVNVPRYFRHRISEIDCIDGGKLYFSDFGFLFHYPRLEAAYHWTYFVVGIVIPFAILIFCNVQFIKALRRSMRMRREAAGVGRVRSRSVASGTSGNSVGDGGVNGSDSSTANRLTLTLAIIVAMYFALVIPAEVMNFLKEVAITNPDNASVYHLVLAVANALQAANFAFNFLLYCAVNTHFRHTVLSLVYYVVCCRHRRRQLELALAAANRRRSHASTCTTYYRRSSQAASTFDRIMVDDDSFSSLTATSLKVGTRVSMCAAAAVAVGTSAPPPPPAPPSFGCASHNRIRFDIIETGSVTNIANS